jgi:nucleoside 2-deoxyribosyltransferase
MNLETNKSKIYLAGPMTGLPEYNYPAFFAAEQALKERGFAVLNPASSFGGDVNLPREYYLRSAISMLLQADAVMLLDGWEKSKGAKLEREIAFELGLKVVTQASLKPTSEKD